MHAVSPQEMDLAANAVFELLAAANRALFTRGLTEVRFQAGETIIRRGETAPGLYI